MHQPSTMRINSSRENFFVILMMGGSVGSSWLQELLDSHPRIRCEGEHLFAAPAAYMKEWFASRARYARRGHAAGPRAFREVFQGRGPMAVTS